MFVTIVLTIRPIIVKKELLQRFVHSAIAIIFLVPLFGLNAFNFTPDPYSDLFLIIIPIISIIGYRFVIYLYFQGMLLGIKRQSMQTVHLGTTLLHQSLKNTIGNIKLYALNIQKSLNAQQYGEIESYVNNLLKTHDVMMRTM